MLAVCLTGSTVPGWAEPGGTPITDSARRLARQSASTHDGAAWQPAQRRRSGGAGALKGAVIGGFIGIAVGVYVAAFVSRDSGEPNFVLVLPPFIGFSIAGGYVGYQLSK
jgi:hypothetical protein